MEFARPIGVFGLLALPLILWLHRSRRSAPERIVASIQPWRALVVSSPRRRKVPPSVLLAIRLAVATALAVALIEPLRNAAGSEGGEGERIIVMDTTTSMAAGDRWRAALAGAKAEIAAARGPVSIVTIGTRPRIHLMRESDSGRSLASLSTLEPGGSRPATGETMKLIEALMEGNTGEAVVISDLEPSALPELAERARWTGVGEPLDNVAVVAIDGSADAAATLVTARIANLGRSQVSLLATLHLDDERITERGLTLDADSARDIGWSVGRSARRASVMLSQGGDGHDGLADDDVGYLVLKRPEMPVQLVGSSPAIERAIMSLDEVSLETSGLGTLRSPSEGGVSVFFGSSPERPPVGGVIVVGTDDANASSRDGDLVQLDGGGLDPLARGLDFSGSTLAAVEPVSKPRARTILWSEGKSLVRTGEVEPGGNRFVMLDFAPDRGDLSLRAAFPLLIARAVSWAAPFWPERTILTGQWAPLPSWLVNVTLPDDSIVAASHGTDRTTAPGWYSARSIGLEGPPIEFAANAGDMIESDLDADRSDGVVTQPAYGLSDSIEPWRIALAIALALALIELQGRSTARQPSNP